MSASSCPIPLFPGRYVQQCHHKVTLLPGSSSNTVTSYPSGYTENYFYNGLTENELGTGFGTGQTFMQCTGLPHQTKVFDAAGILVSDNPVRLHQRYEQSNTLQCLTQGLH